jgi:vanillate O-demethylase ferredoxin subunit
VTPAATIKLRLRQIRLEAEDICSYEFVAADSGALPPFRAGAHINLHLPQGRIRSYSLANPPHDAGRYLVAVQREARGRGGSLWMHDALRVGQVLLSSVPIHDFHLIDDATTSVFIAGGIGITPLLSMIGRLQALGRPWTLHYASRSPERTAFMAELAALDQGRGRVHHCFSSAGPERLDIAAIVAQAPADSHLYCCGPARMIEAFVAATRDRPATNVHYERFAAEQAPVLEGGYTVVLQRSGRRLAVPAGKTLLDALLDEGVAVTYACSNGICGACLTRVVAGRPDHRGDFLSEEQRRVGDCMLLCCSGSLTAELVLDL